MLLTLYLVELPYGNKYTYHHSKGYNSKLSRFRIFGLVLFEKGQNSEQDESIFIQFNLEAVYMRFHVAPIWKFPMSVPSKSLQTVYMSKAKWNFMSVYFHIGQNDRYENSYRVPNIHVNSPPTWDFINLIDMSQVRVRVYFKKQIIQHDHPDMK